MLKKDKGLIKKRDAWACFHPKGYISCFWEDTCRLAIYATKESAEKFNKKIGGRFIIRKVKVETI